MNNQYKSIYKANFDTVGNNNLTFSGKSAVLLISIGADYHEGEKFLATIKLLNKSNFSIITIAVADTLQRHNISTDLIDKNHLQAKILGNEWFTRNISFLNLIDAPINILRWDFALAHPEYVKLFNKIHKVYSEDKDYFQSIENTIDKYIERRHLRGESFDEHIARNSCRIYILEECPIIMLLWAQQGYDYIIYPQRISHAMAYTRKLFVEANYPNKAVWLPLRFKRRSVQKI